MHILICISLNRITTVNHFTIALRYLVQEICGSPSLLSASTRPTILLGIISIQPHQHIYTGIVRGHVVWPDARRKSVKYVRSQMIRLLTWTLPRKLSPHPGRDGGLLGISAGIRQKFWRKLKIKCTRFMGVSLAQICIL